MTNLTKVINAKLQEQKQEEDDLERNVTVTDTTDYTQDEVKQAIEELSNMYAHVGIINSVKQNILMFAVFAEKEN